MRAPRLAALSLVWLVPLLVLWTHGARGPSLLLGWCRATGPGVLAGLAVVLAAWGIGAHLAPRLRGEPLDDRPTQRLLEVALGLAALQLAVVALGAASVMGPWSAWVLVGLGLGLAALGLRSARSVTAPAPLTAVALVVAAGLLLPILLSIGAPPTGADELQYHLRLPAGILETGSLGTDPHDPVSAFPRGLHALLALAMGLAGEAAARPLAALLGLLALATGQRLATRLGGPLAGAVALVVACGAPSIVRLLPIVGSDAPQGLFLGVAVLLVIDTHERSSGLHPRLPLLLGVLGGAAFSIKYTAALYFAPVWAVAATLAWRRARGSLLPLVGSALLPVLFAAPWLIANAAAGLHPLYPVIGITPPPELAAAFRFNQTENYGAGAGLAAMLRAPWDLFMLGTEFDRRHFLGRLGPWPLLALPGLLLALARPPVRWAAAIAVAGFIAWSGPLRRVAYLLPLWPVLAALSAVGFAQLLSAFGPRIRAMALAAIALIAVAEVAPAWSDALDDAPAATGRADRAETLRARVDSAPTWEWVRTHVPPGEAIATAFVWEVLAPERRVLWVCAEECPSLRLELLQAGDGAGALALLRSLDVRWIVVRKQPFVRASYPGLTAEEFEGGYQRPLVVLDELVSLHGTERFQDGLYTVYSLGEPK